MTVAVSFDRKAVEITWNTDVVIGANARIIATNPADGDVSDRGEVVNDGRATITYPSDYHGVSDIAVSGSDSGEDTGTITV